MTTDLPGTTDILAAEFCVAGCPFVLQVRALNSPHDAAKFVNGTVLPVDGGTRAAFVKT